MIKHSMTSQVAAPRLDARHRLGALCALWLWAAAPTAGLTDNAQPPSPIRIAVFNFELEDHSAAGTYGGQNTTGDLTALSELTEKARQQLAQSGRYPLVDTSAASAAAVKTGVLRNCDGCEAGIALQLGAQQSFLGVITRVNPISYSVHFQIRDAHTGKLVNEQFAVFLGGNAEWTSGVASLIRHRVLTDP